jgi:hypothetical protein
MKVDWGWTLFAFCLGLLVCVVCAGIAVACSPVDRVDTAEASPAVSGGGSTEILSADEVGEATVYQLLVRRDGSAVASYCVMVQEDTGSGRLGGYVAIDCP